jgi:hypothetical protein
LLARWVNGHAKNLRSSARPSRFSPL